MKQKAITLSGKIITLGEQTLQQFSAGLRGELLLPASPGYQAARRVWNGMIDHQPALIARCACLEDVQEAVTFAIRNDLLLSVRGGGHNVAGYAVCDGGLVIDLSRMAGVTVDTHHWTVCVEGGARWRDVDSATQPFELAVPGGVVSNTGVGGLALGGGLGWLRRAYGLSCDSLLRVEIVKANGKQIHASADAHPDLFWALRGGGGNFGIVTAFTFRLHPVGPLVYFANVAYPLEQADQVLAAWIAFMQDAPGEITADATLCSLPDLPEIPTGIRGRSVLLIQGVYIGDVETGERCLKPLRELGSPLLDLSASLSFLDLQQSADDLYPYGTRRYYWKSMYLETPDIAVDSFLRHFASRRSPFSQVILWRLGGAIDDIPASASAYAHRGMPYLLSIDAAWEEKDQAEENIAWASTFWEALGEGRNTYANFSSLGDLPGPQARSAYGANYARLQAVKRQYDPENRFRMNLNILPG